MANTNVTVGEEYIHGATLVDLIFHGKKHKIPKLTRGDIDPEGGHLVPNAAFTLNLKHWGNLS